MKKLLLIIAVLIVNACVFGCSQKGQDQQGVNTASVGSQSDAAGLNLTAEEAAKMFRDIDGCSTSSSCDPTEGRTLSILASRALMRQPNAESQAWLLSVRETLRERFLLGTKPITDEGLDYIVGGSSKMARGGFQTGAELRSFLTEDPKDYETLATGVESILTAVGYRAIGANWTRPPHVPLEGNVEQAKAQEIVKAITAGSLRPGIGDLYAFKGRAAEGHAAGDEGGYDEHETIRGKAQEKISQVHALPSGGLPNERLPDRELHPKRLDGGKSFVGRVAEAGFEVRANSSGTAPLALAVLEGLGTLGTSSSKAFAASLLTTTFNLGDFHTPVETAAGIDVFFNGYKKVDGKFVADESFIALDPEDLAMGVKQAWSSSASAPVKKVIDHLGTEELLGTKVFAAQAKVAKPEEELSKAEPAPPAPTRLSTIRRPRAGGAEDTGEAGVPAQKRRRTMQNPMHR